MTEGEKATLTYVEEANRFYGKWATYAEMREELDARINAFRKRQDLMHNRARIHEKLVETLMAGDVTRITISVSRGKTDDAFAAVLTTHDPINEILDIARKRYEIGIMQDMETMRAYVEEQEKLVQSLPDIDQ